MTLILSIAQETTGSGEKCQSDVASSYWQQPHWWALHCSPDARCRSPSRARTHPRAPSRRRPPGSALPDLEARSARRSASAPAARSSGTPIDVLDRKLDAVADSGARWLEVDIDWNSIQNGGPTSFWWDATDRVVTRRPGPRPQDPRHGRLLARVGPSRRAARPAPTSACPTNPEAFATFVAAAALRYGSLSTIPNLRNSISELADLERAEPLPVRAAHRRRRRCTPGAQAGLRRDQGGRPRGHRARRRHRTGTERPVGPRHAAGALPPPDLRQRRQGLLRRLRPPPVLVPLQPADRRQLERLHADQVHPRRDGRQNGDGAKKIWGTEAGVPTGSDIGTCTAGNRAARSARRRSRSTWPTTSRAGSATTAASPARCSGTRSRTTAPGPTDYDDHFGLVRRDFSKKPAYRTFQRLIRG